MGHHLVPLHRRRTGRLGGQPPRGRHRPRLPQRRCRLPGRGTGVAERRTAAGRAPAPHRRAAGPHRRRAAHVLRRGSQQPGVLPRLPADDHGVARHRPDRPDLPGEACRPGAAQRRRVRPAARRRGGQRRDARAGGRRPAPRPSAARSRARPQRGRRAQRGRHRGRCPRPARPGAGCARAAQRDARGGRGPRPYRLGLAVAAARDRPQVRPHVRLGHPVDGRLPRVPLRVLAGRAVRLDRAALPRPVRAHSRTGGPWAVRTRGQHVGGSRHEPAQRREHRAPDGARPALLREPLRRALQRRVDPRRLRLPGLAAADLRQRRCHPVHHPEAQLEQAEPLPAQHVLVGGPRRHPRAHPLPAGRHLQRRGGGQGDGVQRTQLPGPRLERLGADAVRPWQRRRRAHPRDGRARPTDGRPRRCAPPDDGVERRLLRPRRGRDRRRCTRAAVARRAVLRDAPRHPHQPDRDQGGQPPLRAAAARGRTVVGGGWLGAHRGDRRTRRAVARGVAAAVPRHHPRLFHRLGARRRRGCARTRGSPTGGTDQRGVRATGAARRADGGQRGHPRPHRGDRARRHAAAGERSR